MKKFLPILATCLTLSSVPASAIVGGPWDGNNFNDNNQGTYQASISMRNGIGMARFTDHQAAAQFALVNQSIIFYQGAVYLGGAFGNVDWVNYEVSCVTNGQTSADSSNLVEDGDNDLAGVLISEFVDSGAGTSVKFCNTAWRCTITEHAPIMRFAGSGTANFFGERDIFDEEITTTVTTQSDSDGDGVDDTETVTIITETSSGGDFDLEELGSSVRLYVYGAQISNQGIVQLPAASGAGAGGVGGRNQGGSGTGGAGAGG
jgi:hypothetical protein